MKPGSRSCRGETLTASEMFSGQEDASRQAVPQHPFADPAEHSGFLGDRDELGRGDVAELGIVPAQQRLEALDLERLGIDDRLVVEGELAAFDRRQWRAQLDPAALLGAGVEAPARRSLMSLPAAVLGPIEGKSALRNISSTVSPSRRPIATPMLAPTNRPLLAIEEGALQRADQGQAQLLELAAALDRRYHDRELRRRPAGRRSSRRRSPSRSSARPAERDGRRRRGRGNR
jgi:hypothetical protein